MFLPFATRAECSRSTSWHILSLSGAYPTGSICASTFARPKANSSQIPKLFWIDFVFWGCRLIPSCHPFLGPSHEFQPLSTRRAVSLGPGDAFKSERPTTGLMWQYIVGLLSNSTTVFVIQNSKSYCFLSPLCTWGAPMAGVASQFRARHSWARLTAWVQQAVPDG